MNKPHIKRCRQVNGEWGWAVYVESNKATPMAKSTNLEELFKFMKCLKGHNGVRTVVEQRA